VTAQLRRRIGFEIELVAPPTLSRRDLADELSARVGGEIRPVWHEDFGPSQLTAMHGRFLQLSQGLEVRRAGGELLCTLVDDISLVHGLDPETPSVKGWFRLVTDDFRLLRLLAVRCDAGADIAEVLAPLAQMWQARVRRHDDVRGHGDDVYELVDSGGDTIALATPYGGERERPCEIVTPPLADGHAERLEELLAPARELGFTVPHDAAVHLHVDGAPFRQPRALANLIRLFGHWREPLRTLLQTNSASNRLAPLPADLVAAASPSPSPSSVGAGEGNDGEGEPTFERLRAAATESGLTKFFDVNLTQLFRERPLRDTVEIRVLPSTVVTEEIVARAALVERLLDRCQDPSPMPLPPADLATAVEALRAF
jgi:hypothetical protein